MLIAEIHYCSYILQNDAAHWSVRQSIVRCSHWTRIKLDFYNFVFSRSFRCVFTLFRRWHISKLQFILTFIMMTIHEWSSQRQAVASSTPCSEKRGHSYCYRPRHNFGKFRHSFIIFGMNHTLQDRYMEMITKIHKCRLQTDRHLTKAVTYRYIISHLILPCNI